MSPWVDVVARRATEWTAQNEYWKKMDDWLACNFPEFGAHPAARSAVVLLHCRLGKGTLTVAEHGSVIRAAVDRWELEAAQGSEAGCSGSEAA